ncbi:MAG: polyketide synthase, partial [Rhodobacteraceae bacterium]|nr:polyketide synthase [Paracoccaceae bacterium]
MSDSRTSPLAIIGMSARLPGADSLEEIWEILAEGRDVTSEVGADRWSAEALFDREAGVPGRTYTTRGGFLTAVDEFDAAFFGVDPEEARKMDPQQRLSLQEAWHTIEHAGYAPEQLAGKRVGVFVGARTGDYHDPILDDPAELEPETLMGHDTSILSARISHFLDLRGPNLTVNTACSSMGVALHLAGQSLRAGEIDLALVGGVHVMCTAQRFLMHSRSRLLSKRGECRPFDEAADGFVLGEGVGFVLLKSRSAAVADGDHIHGNILATAVNHGGHSEKGIAAPKREAQVAVIHDAITRAKIAPETISYVEAHGTGTYKGDAIEARSLREAYGKLADSNARILMGSAKANFGHALTAAVLPGLLRIVLGFRHRKLAGQAHFDTANELVDMEEGPFRISRNNADWAARSNQPRRAALSAFSYSGTNFHMILEEEPERMPSPAERGPCLVLLSGKTPSALRSRISQLETWMLRHRNEVSLADVAFNLGRGRAHFSYRAAFVASDVPDCLRNLRAWLDRSEYKDTAGVAVDEAANARVQE